MSLMSIAGMEFDVAPGIMVAFYITYLLFILGIGFAGIFWLRVLRLYNIKAIILEKKKNGVTKIIFDKFRKVKSEDIESTGYVYKGWKIKTEVPAMEDSRNIYLLSEKNRSKDLVFYMKLNDKDYRPVEIFDDQQKHSELFIDALRKSKPEIKSSEILKAITTQKDSPIYHPVVKPIPVDMIFWQLQVSKNIIRRFVQKDKIMQMINAATPIMYGMLLFLSYYILIGKFDDILAVTADLPNVCKSYAQNIGK